MKNKKNSLLKKFYRQFLVKFFLWTLGLPLGFAFLYLFIRESDFNWVYQLAPSFYYAFKHFYMHFISTSTFYLFVLVIWGIGVLVLLYFLLKRVFSLVEVFMESAETWVAKEDTYIELPPEFSEIERKMNALKSIAKENERRALLSEQKKDDLIVYLAHDIKTPLTSMIGYLSLLEEIEDMPKKKRQKYIQIALDKSYRLEDLINELFEVARFNSEKIILEKEEFNLTLMFEQIREDFYPILKESQKTVKLNFPEEIKMIGDRDQLSRVFANLIRNAIFYSQENSDILVEGVLKDSEVLITVINKGKDIPKEKLERLFENFYRGDSSRSSRTGGSGVGLAVAKEIITLHEGSIEVTSEKGVITFTVHLPQS